MARTGLMISSLLLYLKFFPTAEESIDYYNQKRCTDGKGLVLPSQIRYVKYFERILAYFNGENQPGRRCMLRGFRLHRCPYWIKPSITVSDHNGVLFSTKKHPRTKDMSPESFWFNAPKKGITVFALPGEPGLTELLGDFKVHFHDRNGDFYCWLNTTMIENRKVLNTGDLDGFDKRKLPSPGFQVEIVLVDYNTATNIPKPPSETTSDESAQTPGPDSAQPNPGPTDPPAQTKNAKKDKDDEFSDSEGEDNGSSKSKHTETSSQNITTTNDSKADSQQIDDLARKTEQASLGSSGPPKPTEQKKESGPSDPAVEVSEFKAMAADASVFSFGDDEDYESD